MQRCVVETGAPPTSWLSLHETGYESYCHPRFTCHSLAQYCTKDKKPPKVQVYSPLTLHAVTIFLLNVYVPRVTHLYPALTHVYFHDLILFPSFPPKFFFFSFAEVD